MKRLFRRLAYWLHLSSNGDQLAQELAHHRTMLEQDLVARGMSPANARVEARRVMGNETYMREEARGVWLSPALDALCHDVIYTLRDLRRNLVFTVGVIVTLALGIGANAAMFSLVDRLLFRPPARLVDPATVHRVHMYRTVRGRESETGGIYARYRDIARWTTVFSQTAAWVNRPLAIGVGEGTRIRPVAIVSASFFGFFDAPPVIGRYFGPSEDEPPAPSPVVVLSHSLWTSEFESRPNVVGSTLQIDAVVYTIIGVAPDGFVGMTPYQSPAAFIPVATYAASRGNPEWATTYTTAFNLGIIVRRNVDVTLAAASADLTNALRRSFQAQNEGRVNAPSLESYRLRAIAAPVLAERGPRASGTTRAAKWLSGVTVIVLLIACANVANLLLTRTMRRRREIAVRVALGVSRARLFGQLLTEGFVLAVLGGAAGLLVAVWGSTALRAQFLPAGENTSLLTDSRTLMFVGVIVLVAGVLVGLAPMTQLGRTDLTGDLKTGAREGHAPRRSLRTALVLVQCALSVILLVGAGLFVRSLQNVRSVRLGFDADSVLVVDLSMRDTQRDSAAIVVLRRRLLESVKTIPGVAYATMQESVPFAGTSSRPIYVEGIASAAELGQFNSNAVSADYFRTMGTRITRGRAIADSDVDGGPPVAVVGESMAAVLWPGQDAIGRCFRMSAATAPCTTVVGIAEDIHSNSIADEPSLHYYYLASAQRNPQDGGLFVRARGDAHQLIEPVRRRLQREMPGTSFVTVSSLGDIVDGTLRAWILGATLFTGFGALALLLAAIGLYSVIACNVAQRNHEIGVRLALGASRREIVRLVVLEGVRFALAGVAIGTLIASPAGRWIGPMLFRQSPADLRVFALVGVVLVGVAVTASCIPAWRAARVDPKSVIQAG